MFKFLRVVFLMLMILIPGFSQKTAHNSGGVDKDFSPAITVVGEAAAKPTKVLWRSDQLCKFAENTRYYPPTIARDAIYITCTSGDSWAAGDAQFTSIKSEYDASIRALNKETGQTLWKHKPESQFATHPLAYQDLVFYTTNGGNWNKSGGFSEGGGAVHALDAATGELKWSYRVKNSQLSYSYEVLGGTLYFSDLNGNLYALAPETGRAKWVYQSGRKVAQFFSTALGNLVLVEGTLYFGSGGGFVFAVDEQTGTLKWTAKTGGQTPYLFSAEDGGLYLSGKKKIYAVDKAGGGLVQLNENQVADLVSRRSQKVSYMTGQYKDFFAKNVTTDEEIWRFKTGRSCAGAGLSGGAVLFTCYDGKLYAVDAQTGALKWSLTTKAPQPTVAAEDGVIYCTIGDGRLYAIK